MIITRTPFRMSFFGGGSDLPTYYEQNGGKVLSTSISKYMYINLHKKFDDGIRLAYSKIEDVKHASEIQHPIVKHCLEYFEIDGGLEISSIADIPAKGTGLGSSSSYAVGLIKAISEYKKIRLDEEKIAEIACHIEIEMCSDPIGKQDQYAAAIGGFNVFEFTTNGVTVKPLYIPQSFMHYFSSSLVTVYTGNDRSASSLLREQSQLIKYENKAKIQRKMVSMVDEAVNLILCEDVKCFGELLHDSWTLKKQLTDKISNQHIDKIYEKGMSAGAWGGKLLGAGMGGFITFVTSPSRVSELKNALSEYTLVNLIPENSGAITLYGMKGNT